MVAPDNPFFARALVNRYWKHFFAVGLVEPEDDMRVTNPASNPELLNGLAQEFIDHQYDMRHLLRLICTSTTYRIRSEANEHNCEIRVTRATIPSVCKLKYYWTRWTKSC
jgi:hypothetical protein